MARTIGAALNPGGVLMRVKVERAPPAPCNPGLRAAPVAKPLVNCYWNNDSIMLVHPDRTSTRVAAKFGLFLRQQDVPEEVLRQLKGSRAVRSVERVGEWWRLECPDIDYRQKLVLWLEKQQKIPTYEGDLNPVRRYLIDAEPQIVAPHHCFLDIESDSRVPFSRKEEMRILVVSIVDGQDWNRPELPHARRRFVLTEDTDADELELLKRVWAVLIEYDQVVAWAGDRFDFELLQSRTKQRGLKVPVKRWLWLDHMELFRRMNVSAAESGEEKQSMALNAIAWQVVGEGKHDFDASKTWEAWEAGGAERERLADYCDQDTLLMPKIEEKTGYIALLGTLCEVTGTFPDTRGCSPQQQVDSFMLALSKKQNYRPRTRIRAQEGDEPGPGAFEGAFVMQPRGKGILRDVHVCDFAAMYPSIILTLNLSPETKLGQPIDPNNSRPSYLASVPHDPVKAALAIPDRAIAPGTDMMFSQSKVGILPLAVVELIRLRKYWNDKKAQCPPGTPEWKEADRRSTAYKVAVNTFYGVVGSPTSMFYDRDVAESVALTGRWLLGEIIKAAEQRGMQCIYGDTDSVFATGATREEFEAFVEWCNAELLPALARSRGCIRNHFKLAYEKEFSRLVFTTAKRYVGKFKHYKGKLATADSKPEVRGLEFRRGDGAKLVRAMQGEVIDLLMGACEDDPAPYHQLCVRWRDHILQAPFELADVKISKKLTRAIRGYAVRTKKDGTAAAQQPHVMIAKILQKRGRDVGEGAKIDYVCVDGSTSPKQYIPAEDFDGSFDRHEMWEAGVFPPTQRLLEAAFPKGGWDAYERTRPAKLSRRAVQATQTLDLFEHANQQPKKT